MKQKRIVTMPRIFAILVVVAILGVTLGAGSALAARGGITGKPGGGGNGGNGTTATLTVSPNPVPCCGAVFDGTGTGFFPSSFAYVNIHTPQSLYATSVATDAAGNVFFQHATAEPGTYTVQVYQYNRHKLVLMAQASLVVQ